MVGRQGKRSAVLTIVLLAASAIIMFASCPGQSGDQGPFIHLVGNPESLKGKFDYKVDLGTVRKDLFFIFSNGSNEGAGKATVKENSSIEEPVIADPKVASLGQDTNEVDGLRGIPTLRDHPGIDKFRTQSKNILANSRRLSPNEAATPRAPGGDAPMNSDTEGQVGQFVLAVESGAPQITAHCRKTVIADFPGGVQRKLSIWVDDAVWSPITGIPNKTDQTMVEGIANKFFGTPSDRVNSIYYLDTNILGQEWAATGINTLIAFDKCITILLYDIDGDLSTNGGVLGYSFADLDNYTNTAITAQYGSPLSNERVMFYIDSVLYATPDSGGSPWSAESHWAEEIYSTLAHEFQHTINFYQLFIVDSLDSPRWINELLSMAIEDLVADKIGCVGPRNVTPDDYSAGQVNNDDGRIPYYNYDPSLSLDQGWDIYPSNTREGWRPYAGTYAFGAFLIRNYGGAQFIKRFYEASGDTETRIEAVTGKKMENIIRDWGLAVMLSDRTDAPVGLRFNTGQAFLSTVNGVDYRLGSINFYNYLAWSSSTQLGPTIYTPATYPSSPNLLSYSNVFYRVISQEKGKKIFTVNLPEVLEMSAIAE